MKYYRQYECQRESRRTRKETHLVGSSVGVTVNAVVGNVQSSLREPLDVSVRKGTGHNGGVGTVPVDVLLGHLETVKKVRGKSLKSAPGAMQVAREHRGALYGHRDGSGELGARGGGLGWRREHESVRNATHAVPEAHRRLLANGLSVELLVLLLVGVGLVVDGRGAISPLGDGVSRGSSVVDLCHDELRAGSKVSTRRSYRPHQAPLDVLCVWGEGERKRQGRRKWGGYLWPTSV
jgi:hypothetical protein